jgi:hypothetical protein
MPAHMAVIPPPVRHAVHGGILAQRRSGRQIAAEVYALDIPAKPRDVFTFKHVIGEANQRLRDRLDRVPQMVLERWYEILSQAPRSVSR